MNITAKITKNAVVRTTTSGKELVSFSAGIRHTYKNKQGEKISMDTYLDCAYWRTTNIAPYLKKGKIVELSGRISASAWVDCEGNLKAGLNFHVSEIIFHGQDNKQDKAIKGHEPVKMLSGALETAQENNDDLPF